MPASGASKPVTICDCPCPRETAPYHPASPGPVKDHELLSRGAYGPTTNFSNGKVTKQIIRKAEILGGGTLSLWRSEVGDEAKLNEIKEKLEKLAPASQFLFEQYTPTAEDFRKLRLKDGRRAVSVVDDCDIGDGASDPGHCGLKVCASVKLQDAEDPLFAEIKGLLFQAIRQRPRGLLASSLRSRSTQ